MSSEPELVGTSLISERDRKRLVTDPKSFSKNVWEQTVTDKEGRRRFHGAFTGGFSAGYFNTVGSKEGWTPKTFSSSRSNRAEKFQQKASDFMDEEDDPMLGRSLNAKLDYDTLGRRSQQMAKDVAQRESRGERKVIPGDLPSEFIVASNNSVGIRLMKAMGWREGQGVGPMQRVGLSGRRTHHDGRVTVDVHAAGFKFAPRDAKVKSLTAKVDKHGVGYVNTADFSLKANDKQLPNRRDFLGMKGGIGTSVLEDNDDIEVYGEDDMSSYSFGNRRSAGSEKRLLHDKASKALVQVHGPFPGFVLADESERLKPYLFKEVEVPKNFKPRHVFPKGCVAGGRRGARKQLTPHERAVALGEVKDASVFDLMSPQSKMKLDKALGKQTSLALAHPQSRAASGALASRFVTETSAPRAALKPGIRGPNLDAVSPAPEAKVKIKAPTVVSFTRSTTPWLPNRILCKRFNVPVPEVQQSMALPGQDLAREFFTEHFGSVPLPDVEPVEIKKPEEQDMSLFKEIFEKTGSDEASSFGESSEDDDEDLSGAPPKAQDSKEVSDKPKDAFHSTAKFLTKAERTGTSRANVRRPKKLVSHRELFNDDKTEQRTTIAQELSSSAVEEIPDWAASALSKSKDKPKKSHKSKKKNKSEKKSHKKKSHKSKKSKSRD